MKVDHYTGEIYHLGKWHRPGCSCLQEPDDEMGLRACDCDDEPEEETEPEPETDQ